MWCYISRWNYVQRPYKTGYCPETIYFLVMVHNDYNNIKLILKLCHIMLHLTYIFIDICHMMFHLMLQSSFKLSYLQNMQVHSQEVSWGLTL